MSSELLPRINPKTEQVIRAEIHIQKLETRSDEDWTPPYKETIRPHDPVWRTRFWSVQHVRDCIEGKEFHWLWTPMAEVFNISQLLFILTPVLVYAADRGVYTDLKGLILYMLGLRIVIYLAKYALEWYHGWRFRRIPYRIINRSVS